MPTTSRVAGARGSAVVARSSPGSRRGGDGRREVRSGTHCEVPDYHGGQVRVDLAMHRAVALFLVILGARPGAGVRWERAGGTEVERQRDETECMGLANRDRSVPVQRGMTHDSTRRGRDSIELTTVRDFDARLLPRVHDDPWIPAGSGSAAGLTPAPAHRSRGEPPHETAHANGRSRAVGHRNRRLRATTPPPSTSAWRAAATRGSRPARPASRCPLPRPVRRAPCRRRVAAPEIPRRSGQAPHVWITASISASLKTKPKDGIPGLPRVEPPCRMRSPR